MQSGFQIILLSQNQEQIITRELFGANDEFRIHDVPKNSTQKNNAMTRHRYMEIHVESKNPLGLHLSFKNLWVFWYFPSKKRWVWSLNPPHFFSKFSYHFGTQKKNRPENPEIRPSCRPKLDVSPSDIFPQILHNFLVSLLCRVHSQHVPNLYLRQFLVQRCLLGNAWNVLAEFMTLAESNGP